MESKIKVTFENRGCGAIVIFGRPLIKIPGSGTAEATLIDNARTAAMIERLRREYPYLVITKAQVTASPATNANSGTAAGVPASQKATAPEKVAEKPVTPKDKPTQASA